MTEIQYTYTIIITRVKSAETQKFLVSKHKKIISKLYANTKLKGGRTHIIKAPIANYQYSNH